MPDFDLIPMETAFATLQQAQIAKEYLGYIDELKPGQMGRLTPSDGETLQTVRRRIGMASRLSDKTVEIKQTKDGVYFWLRSGAKGVEGTRPRKNRSD